MRAAAGLLVVVVLLLLAACDGGSPQSEDFPDPTASASATTPSGDSGTETPGGEPPDFDAAVSRVREDSYYPDVGEPDIDALHYDLDLAWNPERSRLAGVTTIRFRAPADSTRLQLDLGDPLEPSGVRLDGSPVEATHPGKDLVVTGIRLKADSEHTLRIAYSGRPQPVAAPTTRSDVEDLGWHTTDDGGAWTLQEPFGAYSWYPVNDHPSDKAYFDLTIETPAAVRGVSGGAMVSDRVRDGRRTSSFHLAEPVASYLTTIAIGDYRPVSATGPDGLPLTYWAMPGQDKYLDQLRLSPAILTWLTERLGPFPFPTAGVVLVPTQSAMETQETVTMGAAGSTRDFRANLLHEYSHQWYGDMVTPSDWSDMWLNESFAMYLQLEWMADVGMTTTEQWVRTLRDEDQELRSRNGPPGAYDEEDFASANVYYCGALMLHELGRRIGEEELDTLLREWPQQHSYANADRDDWIEFVEDETGRRLEPFVLDWLLSERTPAS